MPARRKRPRVGIAIDMTPMVDIGFLLVIFFMSTYHARPPETVKVDLPLSRSPLKVPESDILIFSILPPERALAMAESLNPSALRSSIEEMIRQPGPDGKPIRYEIAVDEAVRQFKEDAKKREMIQEALALTPAELKARSDSMLIWWNLGRGSAQPILMNEVGDMLVRQRIQNPRLRLVVKTDVKCQSGVVLDLMDILASPAVNMLRFSLVTMLKGE
jgi:biopolymer transport protein ExbD